MRGLFFSYFPGFVRITLGQGQFNDVDCTFQFSGSTVVTTPFEPVLAAAVKVGNDVVVRCQFSGVFCPFGAMLCWLEAVTIGVQECAFAWDAEGPEGRLEWCRRDDDTGFLQVCWSGLSEPVRVMLETRQMVAALYSAIKQLIASPTFNTEQYDSSCYGASLASARSEPVEAWLRYQPL